MAELLIKYGKDTTYKKGDIVMIQEDGFQWGEKECLPDFIVVTVEGTVEDHIHLLEQETDENGEVIKKRKHYIDVLESTVVSEVDKMKIKNWHVPEFDSKKIKIKGSE